MSGDELRRRAQPLLDRAPYEALTVDELRARAQKRRRRSQRVVAAVAVVALIGAGIGTLIATGGRSGPGVQIRTTTPPAPPATVPAGTTVADLRLTEIAGPEGTEPVEIFAVGAGFLAVPNASDVTRLWSGDAHARWTTIPVPEGLRHEQLQAVERVGGRDYVLARNRSGVIVFDGPDLAHLEASSWKLLDGQLPHAMHPAPPRGKGLVVGAGVDAAAVEQTGVVLVGAVSAGFDVRLLPREVRDELAHTPGRVDVTDGRVVVTIGGRPNPAFDRSARALGLPGKVIAYLELPDEMHRQTAVWTAAPGQRVRQIELPRTRAATVLDRAHDLGSATLFNPTLLPAGGGLVLTSDTASASDLWWTRDGRTWRRLASPPRAVRSLVDLGARWVAPDAGIESDDRGATWTPLALGPLPSHPNAATGLTATGTPGFGILGSATPIDASTVTTYASRLYYSPDGAHWSSVPLDTALHFDANLPTIAVGQTTAIVEAGRHALGPQPQRFWLVTLRP